DQPIIIAGIKGDNKTKYLIITAHYAMPSIAAKPAENAAKENVAEKMNVILRSFESQRGMFRNMRFKSNWTSQHYVFAGKFRPGKKPPTPVEVEGKHGLTIQDYQLDKDGRYTTTVERFVVDDATGSKTPHQAPSKYSYNGKIYRAFYSEQQANIFTDKTNIEAGRRLIKPTIFMKHIFDEDIERVLHRPESASFSETADGLWHLECTDNESEKIYEITFDPSRAFMITEMITTTKKGYYVKTQCEYKKTKEGFWHPVKGVRSFKKREPFVMNITEFVLNGPEDDYVLDMPKGTNIRDYTKDPDNPEVYRYGLAHKSYEQITSSKGLFVAGIAVDETGQPVGGVSVQVCCHKRPHGEEGKFSWTFSGEFDVLNAKTDTQGHFAIELEEDGFYNLRFSPKNHAAIIAYDIPVGTSDLKVTLPDGGTVVGRVVCIENGQKVPVPFAEVKLKQCDRASYTHLGFDRERKTKTDPDGRFRFEHVRTRMRGSKTRKSRDWGYDTFRVWELSCENVSQSVTFYEGMKIEKLELLVGELTEPLQLVGKRLSPLDNINIDFTYAETKDKPILLCFWDKNQRPSRRCLAELAKKADDLAAKGIVLIAVHSSAVEQNELDDWLTKNNISIPVGTIKADIKRTLLTWGVRGQPWLILTDRNHTVTAEGFGINELGEKISHK
ncbi:MAG: redoxin domain-containing protein, partial [Sedimentisphaerales bacterium]|nr:redoxin domain-containing protein [Sedimentisphaerales bacterium]